MIQSYSSRPDTARPEQSRQVTVDLLARYDRPGPRYTSYPTAVELSNEFSIGDYEQRLQALAQRPEDPLSIYVHLPFCEQRCDFCGCNVIATPHKDRARPYLDLLRREIDMVSGRLGDDRRFAQLHLGGGTPTYFSPEELTELLEHLLERFLPLPDREMAIEVDPRVTSPRHLVALAALGFNRLSLGVQDLTPQVQSAIRRDQTREQTELMLEWGRELGFSGINVDLVYGLPQQRCEDFERTVQWVVAMKVDRVAVYSFAYVPWLHPHQRRIVESDLPPREEKFQLFSLARESFLEAGYEAIGMDHFARPEDELARAKRRGDLRRNFQGYTVLPAMDVLGFGISAIGDVDGAVVQNTKKLSRYREAVEAGRLPVQRGLLRTPDDHIRSRVIQELMCNFVVDVPSLEKTYGISFDDYFADALERLEEHRHEGMVQTTNRRIAATPKGELFVRNLAMCFDRYWWEKHQSAERPVFSRTV